MRIILLALFLASPCIDVLAATCTDMAKIMGYPCTPPPGKGADDAKQDILDLLSDAESMEPELKRLQTEYLKVRRKGPTKGDYTVEEYAACEAYYHQKEAQDRLYADAIRRTASFYNVYRPFDGKTITIGKPTDPAIDYMTGLKAKWNPKPGEYGPTGIMEIKIRGADRTDHYSGAVRDLPDGGQTLASTFEDGTVLIFKEAFAIALRYENPGYIGHLLYHEARHFLQLSRSSRDGSSQTRSFSTEQEDEAEAYLDDAGWADVFGLDDEDKRELEKRLKKYEDAVAKKEFTWRDPSPAKAATRKKYYEEVQINLEEEYFELSKKVKATRELQEKKDTEERARRTSEFEKRDRLQREAENRRLNDLRTAAFHRQILENEAAACGYDLLVRSRETGIVIGMSGLQRRHGFTSDGILPFNFQDLKITLLLTRVCDAIQGGYKQVICNDSAQDIRDRAATSELKDQLDHILGEPNPSPNARNTRACVDYFISNSAKISDAKSLEKVIAQYHKKSADENRKNEVRSGSGPTTPPARGGGGSPPPTGDDQDYIYDPGCECMIRRR